MVNKRWAVKLAIVLILLFAGFFTLAKSLNAQTDKSQDVGVSFSKLEQILDAQKDILNQLAAIKEQLNSIQLHTNKL
ncbi:MAG: hypothetical protein PHN59_02945 [Candidatus Omnitrophica bacterium]|nr:hypothetical protein [Candidatus Omnitrophota bacterium]